MRDLPLTVKDGTPRLLIINNKPAFYRTTPFNELIKAFERETGGRGLVAYQVHRDLLARSEWFHTPDEEVPFPVYYAAARSRSANAMTAYRPGGVSSLYRRYRPTHVFAAGWHTPLTMAAAPYARLAKARLGVWVESNESTSQRRGFLSDAYRRQYLRSCSFSVVPSRSSSEFVASLHGGSLPTVRLLNPVSLSRLADSRSPARRLVFIGDFSRRKGFDRFCEVAARLADRGVSAVAWGRDVEGLAALAPDSVSRREAVPLSEIVPHLHSSDVLLILSRVDPAPLTYSEALALGLRMVVSDTIAYREHAAGTAGVAVADATDARQILQAVSQVSSQPRPDLEAAEEVDPAYWASKIVGSLLGSRA